MHIGNWPIRLRRLGGSATVIIVSTVAVLSLTPSSAQASMLSYTGAPGTATVLSGGCYSQDAFGTVMIREVAPAIYARNYTSGAGNDAAWVRFRTVLFDQDGNQASNGWSDFSLAYDNKPASFYGEQVFNNLYARGTYRLRMEIQWWNGSTKLGATWNAVDSFKYYKGGAFYGSAPDVCHWL